MKFTLNKIIIIFSFLIFASSNLFFLYVNKTYSATKVYSRFLRKTSQGERIVYPQLSIEETFPGYGRMILKPYIGSKINQEIYPQVKEYGGRKFWLCQNKDPFTTLTIYEKKICHNCKCEDSGEKLYQFYGNDWDKFSYYGKAGTFWMADDLTVNGNRTYLQGVDLADYHWIMNGINEGENNIIGFKLNSDELRLNKNIYIKRDLVLNSQNGLIGFGNFWDSIFLDDSNNMNFEVGNTIPIKILSSGDYKLRISDGLKVENTIKTDRFYFQNHKIDLVHSDDWGGLLEVK